MPTRIISTGRGQVRDLIVIFHIGPELDTALKRYLAPLGDAPCVIGEVRTAFKGLYDGFGPGRLNTLEQIVQFAQAHGAGRFDLGRVVLIGFSEGCAAPRAFLRSGVMPYGIIALDGTHAAWPVHADSPGVAIWRPFFQAAQRGECLFVGTHSGLTYVESLKPPQGPYASTHRVLELLTGWELPIPKPAEEPVVKSDGMAFVYSWGGIDANAHIRQARVLLPRVIGEVLIPHLGPTEQEESPPDTQPSPQTSLGERCVQWALALVGQHGQPLGSQESPMIAPWRRCCVRGYGSSAVSLNLPPTNWCAIFACAAVQASIQPGERWPHGFRAGVVELVQDGSGEHPEYNGRWRPVQLMRSGQWQPRVGDLAIWDRSQPNRPETSWWRHVSRFVKGDQAQGTFQTVGGNEGDTIKISEHPFSSDKLLGFIEYPREADSEHSPLSDEQREQIGQHVALFMSECLNAAANEHWGRDPSEGAG